VVRVVAVLCLLAKWHICTGKMPDILIPEEGHHYPETQFFWLDRFAVDIR
jgi:hypothetical protein